MILQLRNELVQCLNDALADEGFEFSIDRNRVEIEEFDDERKGEFSTAFAHELAGRIGRSPRDVASEVIDAQETVGVPALIESVEEINGYINYHIDQEAFIRSVIYEIQQEGDEFGRRELDDPDRIITDVSSPNVAKPMHVGHLRNTILSDALMNVLEERGNDVTRDNHIGDWGVPFAGAVVYEFVEGGSEESLEEEGIEHLLELYQRFRQREDDREYHREQAKKWFNRVEEGDGRARELWERFREISLGHFEETYERLDVEFDLWLGESFYALEGWNDRILDKSHENDVAVETDDGALFIPVYPDDYEGAEDPETANVNPSLEPYRKAKENQPDGDDDQDEYEEFYILKADGSTVYGTRDLATIDYRVSELDADRSVYVVASEQDQYFQQLFVAARKMGYDDLELKHVSYGMIPGMSTRDGTLIRVRTLLDQAHEAALDVVREKSTDLPEERIGEVAEKVGLATIKYEMVSVSRDKDLHFEMDEAVSLHGDTGPYLQYQTTRTYGILRQVDSIPPVADLDVGHFDETERELVFKLAEYPFVLEQCEKKYDAAPLATYLMRLAHLFSAFYADYPVLDAEEKQAERVVLTDACRQVFENGLDLLGIESLEQM